MCNDLFMKKSKPEDSNNRYQIFNNSQLSDNNFLNNLNNNMTDYNPFNIYNNPFRIPNGYLNSFLNSFLFNNANYNNNNTNKTKNYKRASMDNDDDLKNLKEPIIDKEKLEDLNKI